MCPPGPLIVALEGIDGAGKSTFASSLVTELADRVTARVGHTPGPAIKRMALALRSGTSLASFLAFMIGNAEAARQYPETDVLILDRYLLSTMVHHHRVSDAWLGELNSLCDALALIKPDLTCLLDLDPAVAAQRLDARRADSPLLIGLAEQRALYASWLVSDAAQPFLGRRRVMSSEDWEIGKQNVRDVASEIMTMFEQRRPS